jgi:hypothetical protein
LDLKGFLTYFADGVLKWSIEARDAEDLGEEEHLRMLSHFLSPDDVMVFL